MRRVYGLEAFGVTIAPKGMILVAGPGQQRFLPNGNPDESFGPGGRTSLPSEWGVLDHAFLLSDGKVMGAGIGNNASTLFVRFCY